MFLETPRASNVSSPEQFVLHFLFPPQCVLAFVDKSTQTRLEVSACVLISGDFGDGAEETRRNTVVARIRH